MPPQHGLTQLVLERIPHADAQRWFETDLSRTASGDTQLLLVSFAGAERRLGTLPVALVPGTLANGSTELPLAELGRIALLLSASEALQDAALVSLVEDLYFRGSLSEKCAVARALASLPAREHFVELAVEICRTNAADLFAAMNCENPFPAAHFTDEQFNQVVLKAMFLDLDIRRIVGVLERNNELLKRQARDFESERRAAGRSVPDGIPWLLQH